MFNLIPSNLRVPSVAVEFDTSRAQRGPALIDYRVLVIGQKTSAGSAVANSFHKVTTLDQVIALAGRGSMLHRQMLAHFANNKFTETYIGVLADAGGAIAAVGSIEFTGPATKAGTLSLYLGGVRVAVSVTSGMTAAQLATAVEAAVNDDTDLFVTADVDSSDPETVLFTANNKGEIGNQFDIRLNYQAGESTPAGIGATITQLTGGTTNPSLTTLIAALGDEWFQVWACPYTDDTSLDKLEDELSSRFGPMRMIDGVCFTAKNDTVGNLTTLGNSRNSPHVSIVGTKGSPTPAMEVASAVAAVVAYYGNIDPARPLHTLPANGVLAPAEADRMTLTERNTLLFDGISTLAVFGGQVQLEGIITTYTESAENSADDSYLYVRTMLTLLYLRYSFRSQMRSRYGRHKLAENGTRFGAGQAVITPAIGLAEAVSWARQMETLGLIVNVDEFKKNSSCEIDEADHNRLNFVLCPTIIGQLVVTAVQIQFSL